MNPCMWDIDDNDTSYHTEFQEEFCCGQPATCKRWGYWFCADHYDRLAVVYGEPEPDEDL